MAKIDYEYQVTEAQVRRYQNVPLINRLRWLEEICVFTKMVRQAPVKHPAKSMLNARKRANRAR